MIERISQYLKDIWRGIPLGAGRSSAWSKLRKEWLEENPQCTICLKTKNIIPHHKKPFNKFPLLELEKFNLVSLCESGGMNCHITFGHLSDFKFYNPNIEDDVLIWKEKIKNRLPLN